MITRGLLRRFTLCALALSLLIQVAIAVASAPADAMPCGPACGGGGGGGDPIEYRSTITVTPPPLGAIVGTADGQTDAIDCSAAGGTCSVTDVQWDYTRPTTDWPTYTFTYDAPGYAANWSGGCTGLAPCTIVNSAASTSLSLTPVDVQAPEVSFHPPARVGPNTPLTVTASDNGTISRYDWSYCHPDGSACVAFGTSGPSVLLDAPAGDYLVKVQVLDSAGNLSIATAPISYVSGLTMSWQSLPDYTDAPSFTFQSDDEAHVPSDDAHRQCRAYPFGGTPTDWGPCTTATSYAPALADGHWTLQAQEIDDLDLAGTVTQSTIVDTQPPAVTFTDAPGEGSTVATPSAQFGFDVTDANPDTVTCAFDAQPATACTSPYVVSGYADGRHTVSIAATDKAGHTTTITRQFAVRVPTTLSPATARISYGQPVPLRVLVRPAGATGTVRFTTAAGATLCTATVSAGAAGCTAQSWALTGGTHTITARYNGNYAASSAPIVLVVTKLATAVRAAAPTSVRHGHRVTVTARGLPARATGTVVISRAGRRLCSARVRGGAARCSFAATMRPGRYALTVRYGGDRDYRASAATVRLRVLR